VHTVHLVGHKGLRNVNVQSLEAVEPAELETMTVFWGVSNKVINTFGQIQSISYRFTLAT
jgi:hypothetical protein